MLTSKELFYAKKEKSKSKLQWYYAVVIHLCTLAKIPRARLRLESPLPPRLRPMEVLR